MLVLTQSSAYGLWSEGQHRPAAMTVPTAQRLPDDRELADAELLRRVALRDQAALGELYDRFSRPLYATAVRMLGDRAEAEDVIHDTFLAMWEKARSFDPQRGSAFSWAVTLVRNRAIDRLRSRRTHHQLLDAAQPADLGYDAAPAGTEAVIASQDDARAVRDALAALAPDQQRALELAFFGGLTQQQIAQSLHEPIGTVKARIRRGLLKLRDLLVLRQ